MTGQRPTSAGTPDGDESADGAASGDRSPARPAGTGSGDGQLDPALYEELRRIARSRMADQRRGHTFVTTDLAHEAFLKLFRSGGRYTSRAHFLATAARAMRQVLVDAARRRKRKKRGAGQGARPAGDIEIPFEDFSVEFVMLDDLLRRLAEFDAQAAAIAEMRVIAGMTTPDIAEALGVSPRTVERDWAAARAWLRRRLAEGS